MEQKSIIKGEHNYEKMLKYLDKFIERFVLCRGCRYPELRMYVEGKDLKSACNSCGKVNSHDSQAKAGKELIKHIKQGGGGAVDITDKDKKQEEESEKPSKKSKKAKKEEDEEEDKEEEKKGEDQVSDAEDEVAWNSKRVGK
jgi:translation initiation factor 5